MKGEWCQYKECVFCQEEDECVKCQVYLDTILREKAKEIVLEIRQYLCSTEFAPEPFTEPVDIDKLTVEFPNQILALLKLPDKPLGS